MSLDYIEIDLVFILRKRRKQGNEPCCDAAMFQFRVAGFLLVPQTWCEVGYEDANLCDFRLLQSFQILPSIVLQATVERYIGLARLQIQLYADPNSSIWLETKVCCYVLLMKMTC